MTEQTPTTNRTSTDTASAPSTASPIINTHVTVESSSKRWFHIISTILVCGGAGMIAYALAAYGWLEVAATALTVFFQHLIRMMAAAGLLSLPKRGGDDEPEDFAETRSAIKQAMAEYQVWQAKSPTSRLAALALGFTVGFMIARWLIGIALGVFASVWVAGGVACVVGAVIIAPDQLSTLMAKMKTRRD